MSMIQIREMRPTDATIAAELGNELGYTVSTALFAERIALLCDDVSDKTTYGLLVAEHEKLGIVGWVYIYSMQPLLTERYAEIGGLVVGTRARRTGAGAALMQAAEAWAIERGYATMRLRSGMHRPEAHLFYEKIGYAKVRESMMFQKTLASSFINADC